MAEIELSVINNQGLPALVGTLEEMRQGVRVWNEVGMEKAVRSPGGLGLPMLG
jgi:hypothetical protein